METFTVTVTEMPGKVYGQYREGEIMTTIKDIARMSGYSIGTVSRVINNRADVSEKAREKISEIIRERGYQPNSNARKLKQVISSEVSIIVRGNKNVFFEYILEEIQIMMRGYDENINVHFIGETDNEVATAARIVSYMKPKGIIFLGGYIDNFRDEFSQINLPCVLVTTGAKDLGFENLSSFTTDYYDAGRFVVNKLLSYGHTRIGILGGYFTNRSKEHKNGKIIGAVETLDRQGITFDFDRDYEPCSYSAESGYEAALRLLRRSPDLTAVLAVSDSIALGAIRALKDIDRRVPEDVSVIGFDGLTYTKYSIPRLATIRQDTAMMAKKCVDNLLMRITYGGPAVHELIPYEFIEGESVAAVRQ